MRAEVEAIQERRRSNSKLAPRLPQRDGDPQRSHEADGNGPAVAGPGSRSVGCTLEAFEELLEWPRSSMGARKGGSIAGRPINVPMLIWWCRFVADNSYV